jgi:L-iditol 2-dehydrogenase
MGGADRIRAAVLAGPGRRLEVREVGLPELEPGSALVAITLSEVCGTDVHLRAGRLAGAPYPLIPGHVSVGRIARLRGALADVEGRPLSEGDPVTFLDVHRTCNACWFCLVAKATTRCPERRVYGLTYGLADGPSGGWAEAIHLKPGTRLVRLDGVDPERFMAGGCALPTALHAVERGRVGIGDTVLVLGSGPVGLSATALARMQGARSVLCIGGPEGRLRAAAAMGASDTLDLDRHDPPGRRDWVLARSGGRGADVTIEATGSPEAVVQAMRCTRDAGRVVVAGQYADGGETSFNPHADLNRKHLEVLGCWGSDLSHLDRAVHLMADPERSAPWGRLPLPRYGLARADEALDDVAAGRVVKALIDPAL